MNISLPHDIKEKIRAALRQIGGIILLVVGLLAVAVAAEVAAFFKADSTYEELRSYVQEHCGVPSRSGGKTAPIRWMFQGAGIAACRGRGVFCAIAKEQCLRNQK